MKFLRKIKITRKGMTFAACAAALLLSVLLPPALHRHRQAKQWEQAGVTTSYPVLWESHYDADGILVYYYHDEYDEAGRLLRREYDSLKKADDLVPTRNERDTYIYDSEGRMLAHTADSVTCRITTRWQYDASGRLLQKTEQRDGTGAQESPRRLRTTVYAYADDGTSATATVTLADGSAEQYEEWKFDGDGRELQCVRYDENHVMTRAEYHDYDEKGRLVKKKTITGYGDWDESRRTQQRAYTYEESVAEYTYNENGAPLHYAVYGNNTFSFGQDYEYDENGRLVRLTLDAGGDVHWFAYLYDKKGRLAQRQHFNQNGQMTGALRYGNFDSHGNAREVIEYADGREAGRVVKTYGYRKLPDGERYGNQTEEIISKITVP